MSSDLIGAFTIAMEEEGMIWVLDCSGHSGHVIVVVVFELLRNFKVVLRRRGEERGWYCRCRSTYVTA